MTKECPRCKVMFSGTFVCCDKCREYSRKSTARRTKRLITNNQCADCGEKLVLPTQYRRCSECRAIAAIKTAKKKEDREKEGKCPRCGKIDNSKYKTCEKCRERVRAYRMRKKQVVTEDRVQIARHN